ncbi:MAG TPA: [NiFe]-hydrogenase assembly chaperone HybE [Burkholderiaceae bacterium]|nr:[NiFe]-hydrogenase assembly chaperone HybE [Burkholderiaceae bacterium]HMZ00042.1 [NiFe]-hydrogenase assembly chaperone HybE [Burkholderiaceae bacterium]HNB44418.1 [NiFe]-hydrogenase assembly chaperone HybE [Burkholderiaceae bacterium]HNG79855.1 [NiFe]-hydrogenase assembly chaperone HybE [Burkholderiaceae bacterium]
MAMLNDRIDLLERSFRHIASTRMAGVPVLHAALQVRAVGFAALPDEPGWLCGVLVTPWFMNLLRLPLEPLVDPTAAAAAGCLDVGRDAPRVVFPSGGGQPLHFVGAQEDRLGHYEQCSLYSPMFHFADQAAAVATAAEVMKLLRNPPRADDPARAPTSPPSAPPPATRPPDAEEPRPARRGFLFGRGAPAPSPR